MATFDLVLLLFLGGFVLLGFFAGLFQTLGSLLGIFAGYFAASRLYEGLGAIIEPLFFHNERLAEAIAFIIIFLCINRLVGLVFWVLAKVFQLLRFVPFFEIMNRIAGALLGFIEGLFAIGIVLSMIDRILDLSGTIEGSEVAQLMVRVADWFEFLLPVGIRTFDSLVAGYLC